MKRDDKSNIKKIEKEIEEKKKIPRNIKEKVSAKIFENVVILAIIMIYLISLNFGMNNIPTENYIMDLKVFSIMLLIITIFFFEIGYKKDNGSIWLHGVEIMVIGVFTLYLIYLYSIYYSSYGFLILYAACLYLVYYIIKILVERKMIKKDYMNSLTDINEIVKK